MIERFNKTKRGFLPFLSALVLASCGVMESVAQIGDVFSDQPTGSVSKTPSARQEEFDVAQVYQSPGVLAKTVRKAVGIVIADEPHAALVGQSIINAGGNAADVATATYFALSVTYPNAAGLGGGGVCLHRDAETGQTESIDFLPRSPSAGGKIAIPGNVRGFGLLHARHGALPWNAVIQPAEKMAGGGAPASRALVQRLAANSETIRRDSTLKALYVAPDDTLRREGDGVTQLSLAVTLGLIRSRGPVGFYTGETAKALLDASKRAGGKVTGDDLRVYRPTAAQALRIDRDDRTVVAPANRTGAGALASAVWGALHGGKQTPDEPTADRFRRVVQETLEDFEVKGALPVDFGSTGFLAVDKSGDAVACAVTMNGPFGIGKMIKTTGFAIAPSPHSVGEGLAGAFLMPLIVLSQSDEILFVGSAAGGPEAIVGEYALAHSLAIEKEGPMLEVYRGLRTGPTDPVNALYCRNGWPDSPRSCEFTSDPQGDGLGIEGGRKSDSDSGGFFDFL